jgi:hypothetical protein
LSADALAFSEGSQASRKTVPVWFSWFIKNW